MKAESILKTAEDHHQFLFWIATLESEVLPKGIGRLQREDTYCCLGVGVCCTKPVLRDMEAVQSKKKIDAYYKAIIQFIDWHNTTNK